MLGSTSRPASCFALLLSLPSVASSHRHSGHLLAERDEGLGPRAEGLGANRKGLGVSAREPRAEGLRLKG